MIVNQNCMELNPGTAPSYLGYKSSASLFMLIEHF